jgi:apolipoprotein N-acyltransferase
VVPLCGWRSTAVICREIEDADDVQAQLLGSAPQLVLWPGLMGPEAGFEHITPPRHVQQAQALAQRLGAWVVQSNWPMNLNYPDLNAKTGASVVVSPAGHLLLTLPQAQAGLAVFNLGESQFEWLPAAAH